jgi:hypothetical protein
VASDPLDLVEDLTAVVARARSEAAEAGELLPSGVGVPQVDLEEADREFILSILRDGSYAEAVAQVAERDPDLANQ